MKKVFMIMVASIFLVGCTNFNSAPAAESNTQAPAADQKQGDTSKTGTISQSGTIFFINVVGQEPEIIESYGVNLADYVGQTVTITGQYSGDTLFVGSIK